MSTSEGHNLSIGARIRQERLSLGLSQEIFAKKLGVHRKSQGNYESGASGPDASYLEAAVRAGVDVVYVLTGEREQLHKQSLAYILGVIFHELDAPDLQASLDELRKLAYEELCSITLGSDYQPKIDREINRLLRRCPNFMDNEALSDVIERLEFVAETKSLTLSPQAKAFAIRELYRSLKISGKTPDLQTVTTILESKT